MSADPDLVISVIVTTHGEGRLAHPTLRSVARAIRHAESVGMGAEVIVMADRPTADMDAYLAASLADALAGVEWRLERVDVGDPGLSRNVGTSLARGEFVTFIDGDNLMSENWLAGAVEVLRAAGGRAVVHPELMLSFGDDTSVWRYIASTDPAFDPYALAEINYWDTFCATSRALALELPFEEARSDLGFGFEDWHWNCVVLQNGIDHLIAPESILFYRLKRGGTSRLEQQRGSATLLAPTDFLSDPRRADELDQRNHPGQGVDDGRPVMYRTGIRGRVVRGVARGGFRVVSRFVKNPRRLVPIYEKVRDTIVREMRPNGPVGRLYERGAEPAWLLDEWRAMHDLELELYPGAATLDRLFHYVPIPAAATRVYWSLLRQLRELGGSPDYLFLVPWLLRGGADQVVLNYVNAVHELGPDARIAMLATMPEESIWADKLPEGVRFVTVPPEFHRLSGSDQEHVIGTLLVQLAPKRIHLINSGVGFRVLQRMGTALTRASRVYLSSFVLDRLTDGQRVHYILDGIRDYADLISGVFTDNAPLAGFFRETYALPAELLTTHYQPAGVAELIEREPRQFSAESPLRVLWAGRFDPQKRVDVLAAVAAETRRRGLPVEFHAYGAALLDGDTAALEAAKAAGVQVHKPFDASNDPFRGTDVDAFLMTSEWEGIPIVLITAAGVGLPTIASEVGGMPEVVTDETGYPVARFDDAGAYADSIAAMIDDYPEALRRARAAHDLVAERHRWERFVELIAATEGYAPGPLASAGATPGAEKP